jgi:hypothetical protein
MPGVGSRVRAADYNAIQGKVALVLGNGTGNYGYGQSLVSSQVAVGDLIRAVQWNNLRTDLLKARQHQTGVDETSNLTLASTSSVISEALRAQYDNMADTVTANRLAVASNQGTLENVVSPYQRTSAWNGTLTHTCTVTFSSYDAARHFFNAGGNFQISASRTGGNSGSKNNTWTLMLSQMGTITMNYTTTVCGDPSSTATTYPIGFYSLSNSNQMIFRKQAPAGAYAENDYFIYARLDGSSIVFSIVFEDEDAGDLNNPSPGFPPGPVQDEDVDGTLTSYIQMFRPSGSNVSVAVPSASQSGF